jgi:L-lactate dehydrogenase complex protein LldG
MTGRKNILERIWQNKPEQKPLPNIFSYQDESKSQEELVARFTENLKKAGASMNEVIAMKEVTEYIENNFSDVVDLLNTQVRENYGKRVSTEELETTKEVIIEGQFGVAENGAVWVDETNFPVRLLPFITRELVLVMDKKNIVSNMHEAYKRLNLNSIGFGVFISGPSKTADIEQSLVYGAHGAKELIVIIY